MKKLSLKLDMSKSYEKVFEETLQNKYRLGIYNNICNELFGLKSIKIVRIKHAYNYIEMLHHN